MGLTRTSEGWSGCYRYLLSPLPGQIPFSAFPVNDVIQSAESCRPDASTNYPELQTLCPAAFSQSFHHSLEYHAEPEHGTVTTHQPCPAPTYISPFTDVNSLYSCNLENYGSTNVGAAVAISLASLSSTSRDPETESHLTPQHQAIPGIAAVVPEEEYVCSDLQSQSLGEPIPSESSSIQTSQVVDPQQNEYLLSELLGGDPELLGICHNRTTSCKNYYRQVKEYPPDSTEDGRYGSNYAAAGIAVKEWEKSQQKGESQLTEQSHLDLNVLCLNFTDDRCNDQSSSGQKKYQLYGKWKPSSIEEKMVRCESMQIQDAGGYILQTPPTERFNQEPVAENAVYDSLQARHQLQEQSDSSCSSFGDRVGDAPQRNSYCGDNFSVCQLTDDDESCKDLDKISKDEKRARAMELPITNGEIILLAIDEFNERISKFELTDAQLSLIRDIRRRGKNKVAAQNCRKRKLDQISNLQKEIEVLHMERSRLQYEQEQIMTNLQFLKDRYYKLFQLISQSTNRHEMSPDLQQLLVQR